MIKLIITTALLCLVPCTAIADQVGHEDFQNLDLYNAPLIEGIFSEVPFMPVGMLSTKDHRISPSGIWRGSKPNVEVLFRVLWLDFAPSIEGAFKPFSLRLIFDENQIVIAPSNPRTKPYKGGIRFTRKSNKSFKAIIESQDSIYVAAAIPLGSDPDLSGVLICPRILPKKSEDKQTAEDTPLPSFVLKSLRPILDSYAAGRILSGINPGYGKAEILTSKNIPSADPFFDEVTGRDPSVNVEYFLKQAPNVEPSTDFSIVIGSQASLELRSPGGERRLNRVVERLNVRQIELDRDFAAPSLSGEVQVPKGTCYSIIKVKETFELFDRMLPPKNTMVPDNSVQTTK